MATPLPRIAEYPPQTSVEDRALFDRVAGLVPLCDAPTRTQFDQMRQQYGDDFATAWAYLALRQAGPAREFIGEVERHRVAERPEAPLLMIVPGAFYRHHRTTGADGSRLIRLAKQLGWESEIVPVESFGALERNGATLIDYLRRFTARRVVLASLSKGSADVALALRHPQAVAAFERVEGWVSLSGLIHGTPLVDWLRARPLRATGVHLLLWLRGQRYATVEQLRCGTGGPLAAPLRLPAHIRVIHVVGFPLRRHLSHRWAFRAFDRLTPLGPSDGGGQLLVDTLEWPGLVYPVWGADHYLQPSWESDSVFLNILRQANHGPGLATCAAS